MARNVDPDPFVNFITMLHELGLENTPVRRFYAKYPGRVEEIKLDDRGLVRVCVGEILNKTMSVWAYPDTYAGDGYGLYLPPMVGDPVWVTFVNGDPTLPRYSGGWWCAPSDNPNSAVSHLPTEFKNPGLLPSTSGFVSPAGHGWLAEGQFGRDQRFEIWSGFLDPDAPRVPIVKHHQLILADEPGNERAEFLSFKGHKIRLVDIDGQEKIEVETQGGHKALFDDTPGQQKVEITTALGQTAVMDDTLKKIELSTAAKLKVSLDDILQRASIETPTQAVELLEIPLPTINIRTPGAVNVVAGGLASITGAGVTINSGAGVSTMVGSGAAIQKFDGAMVQEILSLNVVSDAIKLGDAAGAVALVTEAFLTFFAAHTHNGNLGAPTGPPNEPVIPATHATTKTKAS